MDSTLDRPTSTTPGVAPFLGSTSKNIKSTTTPPAQPKLNIPLINTGFKKSIQSINPANSALLETLKNRLLNNNNKTSMDLNRERDLALTKEILESRRSIMQNNANSNKVVNPAPRPFLKLMRQSLLNLFQKLQ